MLGQFIGTSEYSWIDAFTDTNGVRLDAHTPTGSPELGPSSIVSATGTISGNAAIHTEELGAEKFTNPTIDVNTNGWVGLRGTIASVAGGQSNNCLELTMVEGATQLARQDGGFVSVAGTFYSGSVYVKSGTSGNEAFSIKAYNGDLGAGISTISGTSSGSWVQYSFVFKAISTTSNVLLYKETSTAGTMLFDEITVKPITLASILTLTDLGFSEGRYWYTPANVAAGELAGIVVLANDSVASTDGLFCYVDRTAGKLQVFKRVAGTDTSLISTAITYSEGAQACLVYDASEGKIWAFYNNAIVGTAQALTDASIINNTWHGILTTGTATITAVDYAPLGYATAKAVTGITKANPGVVSATDHGYSNGDLVYFSGLTEMTEMNAQYDIVAGSAADTFTIRNTSGFVAAETTGGNVVQKIN